MLTEKDYCDYETCVALKELGYNEESGYTWVKHYRVRDEILEKHSGLSDDGYLELTEEYGGSYRREEVFGAYVEPIKRWSKNSILDSDFGELCSCIHLYEAQKFLREEKGFDFEITIYSKYRNYLAEIRWNTQCILLDKFVPNGRIIVNTYEEALLECIKIAVKLLKGE